MLIKVYSQAWNIADNNSLILIEQKLDCCGSGINSTDDYKKYETPSPADHKFSFDNKVFVNDPKAHCHTNKTDDPIPASCHTCFVKVQEEGKITKAFRSAGGLGLFFSFPEVRDIYSNLISPISDVKIIPC